MKVRWKFASAVVLTSLVFSAVTTATPAIAATSDGSVSWPGFDLNYSSATLTPNVGPVVIEFTRSEPFTTSGVRMESRISLPQNANPAVLPGGADYLQGSLNASGECRTASGLLIYTAEISFVGTPNYAAWTCAIDYDSTYVDFYLSLPNSAAVTTVTNTTLTIPTGLIAQKTNARQIIDAKYFDAFWGASSSSTPKAQILISPTPLAPDAPEQPTVVAGDGEVTVTVAAASTGAEADSFTVTSSPGGLTCTFEVPATECVVLGLSNGTSYSFTATASNDAGTSPASVASTAVTPVAASEPDESAKPTSGTDESGASRTALATTGFAWPQPVAAAALALLLGALLSIAVARRKARV